MQEFRNEADILRYAIEREDQAYKFYAEMATPGTHPTLRRLFEKYAQEEIGHKMKLELELLKLGYVIEDGITTKFLEDTADMVAIGSELQEDYQALLQVTIVKEKKSFRTYVKLAYQTQQDELREMLLELAEEEARHKTLAQIELEEASLREKG